MKLGYAMKVSVRGRGELRLSSFEKRVLANARAEGKSLGESLKLVCELREKYRRVRNENREEYRSYNKVS